MYDKFNIYVNWMEDNLFDLMERKEHPILWPPPQHFFINKNFIRYVFRFFFYSLALNSRSLKYTITIPIFINRKTYISIS